MPSPRALGRTVTCDKQPTALIRREFDLLHYLVVNSGSVYPVGKSLQR